MIKCPHCGHEQQIDGRFCISCKKELDEFEKTFTKKILIRFAFTLIWSLSVFLLGVFLIISGVIRLDELHDYLLLMVFLIHLILFLVLFSAFIKGFIRRRKLKDDIHSEDKGLIQEANKQILEENETVRDKIAFLNMAPTNGTYSIYFTERGIIFFSLGGPKRPSTIKKMRKLDEEADLLSKDANKLLTFYPLNTYVKYSDISKVIIEKRYFSMAIFNPSTGKEINIMLFIIYDKKNKKRGFDYTPILSKYLGSKLFDKKGNSLLF